MQVNGDGPRRQLRQFKLQLSFVYRTSRRVKRTSHADFIVTFDEATTVSELIDEAVGAIESHVADEVAAATFAATEWMAEVVLRHKGRATGERRAHLPAGASVHECGLRNGSTIYLVAESDAPELALRRRDDAELFLIDSSSPDRGRATPLEPGRALVVGSDPVAEGDEWPVVVDDARCSGFAFRLESRTRPTGAYALLNSNPNAGVFVNGVRAGEKQDIAVHAGSIIELHVHEQLGIAGDAPPLRVVTFTLTKAVTRSEALSDTELAFGRVRLEPAARAALPTFTDLGDGQLPDRPNEQKPRFNAVQALIPLVMGVAILFFGGSWFFLLFAASQPLVYAYTYITDRRRAAEQYTRDLGAWRRKTDAIIDRYASLVEAEQRGRRRMSPSAEVWCQRALRRLPELWERRPTDQDFLEIRLGTGYRVSAYRDALKIPEFGHEREELRAEHETLVDRIDRASLLEAVPAVVNLIEHDLAIIGSMRTVSEVAAGVLLQLAAAHSPSTLAIAALLPEDATLLRNYDYVKWLPNVQGATTLLPRGHCALGRGGSSDLLLAIIEQLSDRRQNRSDERSAHVILVIHEGSEVDQTLLAEAKELGEGLIHFLWLGSTRAGRPAIVDTTLELLGPDRGVVDSTREGFEWHDSAIDIERVINPRAQFVAQCLAPLHDPRTVAASQAIPDSVPLSTVLDLDVEDGFPGTPDKLNIPLGLDENGIFFLDLVKDGPHVLIGGTTDSGKSGLLQSMVASLTVSYDPSEVTLILIDFKGGLTFGDFEELPHVVGYASDLDESSVTRILDFLHAELRRRLDEMSKVKTSEGRVPKNIDEYRTCPEAKELPRLVVIVDEFATLVTGSGGNGVVARVVDIAQRGRALGVHLVLATQQPSNQVINSQVKANVGAKIALRTVDANNSDVIIDAPDAAQIPKALQGRALARLDGGRLVQFQTAYSEVTAWATRSSDGGVLSLSPFVVAAA
jgi:hypothetical protein